MSPSSETELSTRFSGVIGFDRLFVRQTQYGKIQSCLNAAELHARIYHRVLNS